MSAEKGTSKCRPIIVLGVERSGTSLVAEMVHRWGAYAGESERLTKADERNPQGYWEYKPIWDFLDELIKAVGISWWDASFQQRVREKVFIPQYRDKARELVAVMEKEGKSWVWKDPALSFFLPFWKEIWGDADYLITVRNPYDSALSWQKFVMPSKLEGSMSLIAGNILRWQYMMLLILEHTEETENKIFIPYEGLVLKPWKQAKRLYEFLNRNCEVKVSDDMGSKVMAQTVNPKLWRNRSQSPFSQVHEATNEQKALYQFIERKVKNPLKKFEIAKYPMYAGWQEFVKNEEMLLRMATQIG
ncbi:sulfotransferase [Candidatus Poribacteria bacterium]|nr:sulfotransferase [Candidatus Poribacteria bacterium]